MTIGKIVGIAASAAIIGVMGYIALDTTSGGDKEPIGIEQNQSATLKQADAATPPANPQALTEEEKKIKELKDDTKEFKVSDTYILKCSPCHGDSGKGAIGPQIYGKSEQELLKKLYDYKEGRVKNSMMAGLLTNSTDDDLKSLAKEISQFGK